MKQEEKLLKELTPGVVDSLEFNDREEFKEIINKSN